MIKERKEKKKKEEKVKKGPPAIGFMRKANASAIHGRNSSRYSSTIEKPTKGGKVRGKRNKKA